MAQLAATYIPAGLVFLAGHTNTQWPGVTEAVRPPNAGLRLFGGAAFERCLNEFQEAANALRFPSGKV